MPTSSTSEISHSTLAVNGGQPVRADPMPPRHLFGQAEKQAVMALFDETIETGQAFTYGGPREEALTHDFAQWMGGGFADGVNSGTTAIFVALHSLGLEAGCEVIVPPITDAGGVMPVALLNAIPVVADSAPGSYNMGPDEMEACITDKTRAVIVAHIAGNPAQMDRMVQIARKYRLKIVEDCAQSPGARYQGQLVGTFGDVASFSTMSGKHFATGGQGGLVYTRDEELYWKIRRAADRGKPFNLENASSNVIPSLNFNMDEISAAIGCVQLTRLPQIIQSRQTIANAIHQGLANLQAIKPPQALPEAQSCYWFMPLKLDTDQLTVDKATFVQALSAEGLPIMADYRHIPTEATWFQHSEQSENPWLYRGKVDSDRPLPHAIQAIETHFNLMIHENWTQREIQDTLTIFAKVEKAYCK